MKVDLHKLKETFRRTGKTGNGALNVIQTLDL